MSLVSLREVCFEASRLRYAVGAFNVTSPVQMKAAIETAVAKKAPLIIQTSLSPVSFYGPEFWGAAYRALAEKAPVPVVLHLDHCTDIELCKRCVDAGYTSVMIDASKHPYEENVRQTREVSRYAHARNVSVEAELGTISGIEDQIAVTENESALCDPETALRFVDESGLDLLAPAIGTAHGFYTSKNPRLHFDILDSIEHLLNGVSLKVPLVIHGGTGLPEDSVRRLVASGGAKLNVSTDLKHRLIDATVEYLAANSGKYDPGKLDAAVLRKTSEAIGYWMDLLGSAGRA